MRLFPLNIVAPHAGSIATRAIASKACCRMTNEALLLRAISQCAMVPSSFLRQFRMLPRRYVFELLTARTQANFIADVHVDDEANEVSFTSTEPRPLAPCLRPQPAGRHAIRSALFLLRSSRCVNTVTFFVRSGNAANIRLPC